MCSTCGCGNPKDKHGKKLSPKQKKLAGKAGDPKKIDAADLAALRKKKKK